jgi:hypothetical protein
MAMRRDSIKHTLNMRLVVKSLNRSDQPVYAYGLAQKLHFPDVSVLGPVLRILSTTDRC